MVDNELLSAISNMLDVKFKPELTFIKEHMISMDKRMTGL